MIIYKQEQKDGLESIIRSNTSISAYCPILSKETILSDEIINNPSLTIANLSQDKGLYKLYSILVSVGWNLNDDIFLREEIWKARHSPQDKPFNLEHNPRQIIGHITKSCVVDEDYKLLDDNISFDDLPEKFHILTAAVLYRHKPSLDKDLTKETEELISSIANGDWFVSMEVTFPDFDYGLSYANGTQTIIERNKETCFLSKYLKVYNGVGSYNNAKIGRVLKNISFSGKGLVKIPGNPESYIFTDTEKFVGVSNRRKEMTVESKGEHLALDVVSREEYATAQKEISDLRNRLEAAKEENVKKKIEEVQASASKKDEEISSLKTELENVKASKKDLESSLAKLNESVTDLTNKLSDAEEVLAKAAKEKIISNRVSTLIEKGVEKSEAEKIVTASASTSDEVFALLVDAHAKIVSASAKKSETEKAKEDEGKLEQAKEDEGSKASLASQEEINTGEDQQQSIAKLREYLKSLSGGK